MANFWTATCPYLDEEFDEPDAAADRDLCRAIVAGKAGLHPDVWGAHDPLATLPPHHRRPFVPPVGFPGEHSAEWKPHTPRHGEVQLTCDVCNRVRFHITLEYRGDRWAKVEAIRIMGRTAGWTCIAGTDRCPRCSQAAAPKPVGNGTGGDQGDKQHA